MFSLQKEAYDVLKESYRRRIAAALQEKGIGGSGALIFEGDSIEERILTLQDKKHALAAELIEELGEGRRVFLCEELTLPGEKISEIRNGGLTDRPVSTRAIILIIKGELLP